MASRSLFRQFNQIAGSLSFEDLRSQMSLAEDTGRSYNTGTMTVVSGSAVMVDSVNVFEGYEKNNYIVIAEGDAAGIYQITAASGTGTISVSPTPTSSDASASYNAHYFKNLEDDLNYVRAQLHHITGQTNWYDVPTLDLIEIVELISTTSGTLQDNIDSLQSSFDSHTHTESDITDLDKYTQTEVDGLLTTLSGSLADQISAANEFIELTDTPTSFSEGRILFESLNAVVDDSLLTYVSGTQTLNVPNIDATGNISLDGTLGFDAGTTINEFTTTVDVSSTDDQAPTAKAVYDDVYVTLDTKIDTASGTLQSQIDGLSMDHGELLGLEDNDHPQYLLVTDFTVASGTLQDQIDSLDDTYATDAELAAVSGTLQGQIDSNTTSISNNYTTLDGKIDTTSGTLQSQIDGLGDTYYTETEVDNLLAAQDEFIELTDTISTFNAGRILFESLTALVDDSAFTYVSGTQTLNVPNVNISTDLDVGGTLDVTGAVDFDGTLSFNDGQDVNEIVTSISSSSTSSQLPTADGVYNLLNTISGTLQADVIWEVVDTPSNQIRPKADHITKALYHGGDVTIAGNLTVSGTTTTVNSEEVTIADKTLTLNYGEVGAGVTGDPLVGIQVDRGSETDYYFMFSETDDNFKIGISGSLQAVATREDSPTNNYVAFWNASEVRFDTAGGLDINDIATESYADTAASDAASAAVAAHDVASVHFTEGSIDHTAILNIGTNSHAAIDTHIADLTIHRTINDAGVGATDLWSASKISSEINDAVTGSGIVDHSLLTNLDYASSGHTGFAPESHTHTESDILDLGTYALASHDHDSVYAPISHSHAISDVTGLQTALDDRYTEAEVDSLLAAQDEFLELLDVSLSSFNDGRVLFTTASGVTDDAAFTFTSVSGLLNVTAIELGTGDYVNEIVTTVTSGTTDQQLPTAKAVWDLTEAAAAAVHTHYDEDASHSSDTVWTFGSGFSAVPEHLAIYVNGMKQRIGASYDCVATVPGGVLTITFNYNVNTENWVNITYIV